jgi:hypothetical protein
VETVEKTIVKNLSLLSERVKAKGRSQLTYQGWKLGAKMRRKRSRKRKEYK